MEQNRPRDEKIIQRHRWYGWFYFTLGKQQKRSWLGRTGDKKITEGERIDFELRFIKPFEATEPAYMTTEAVNENQTKVVWGFSGHMNYPMNLMLLFMDMEEMIGGDLETGLNDLKTILEQR